MAYGAQPGSGPPSPYRPPSSRVSTRGGAASAGTKNGSSDGNGHGHGHGNADLARVALAAKSFRVFGLMGDAAWREARESRRAAARAKERVVEEARAKRKGTVPIPVGDGDGNEEFDDMTDICDAVFKALSPDAGGYGSAGFHTSRVEDVELDGTHMAVWNGLLVPCRPGSGEELDPATVALGDNDDDDDDDASYDGNDERYVSEGPFGLRVTVSRASEALWARSKLDEEYHRSNSKGEEPHEVAASPPKWEGSGGQGYYVECMLLEPDVPDFETVVPPPDALNKSRLGASLSRAPPSSPRSDNVFKSSQFAMAGPWETENQRAFEEIVLDVRKALVRVEFPMFHEGCQGTTFRKVYQLNARLKSGSFATVCRGTHRATGKKVAIKCVLRKDLPPNDDAAIYDEVLILSTLRHRNICPLIDFFEERECYFLVMELMSGGDLFDRIGKKKSYSEEDARNLCRKMLESLRYCHENSVAHCDMKPKNLLMLSEDDNVQVKICDFGFATRTYTPGSLTKQCGTPFFVAPEVLMRKAYDQQADMWSVGVIIFLLLGGDLPFMGKSQRELFRNIVDGKFDFPDESWKHVSDEAKNLIRQLLVTDPARRMTSREAMASPWVRQRGNILAKNNLEVTSKKIKSFNARMKLRSAMFAVDWALAAKRFSIVRKNSTRQLLEPTPLVVNGNDK